MTGAGGAGDPMAALLEQVHAALIHADYGKLGALTEGIGIELARLEAAGDLAALLRVRGLAQRNEACLLATRRGFRAARRRMAEIQAARSGLVTYDTKGRRAEPQPGGELTRRF